MMMSHRWVLLGLSALANATLAADSRLLALTQGKQDGGRTVKLERTVACSPERAYALWSTDEGVRSFFAPASRIGRGPGDEYTIVFNPAGDPEGLSQGTKGARILAASPGLFFAFEWIAFSGDASLGSSAPPIAPASVRNESPLPTWVEIELAPSDGGTRVIFRHYGFREGEPWPASQAWFARAWDRVLDALAATCAREKTAAR
jgi:uncharacterized protein YndB with AHSA1/START domain